MNRYKGASMRAVHLLVFHATLLLLTHESACAEDLYRIQPIVRSGDLVGDVSIKAGGHFEIGVLNDRGHLCFVTKNADESKLLLQYADGQLTAIVVAGKDA